MHLIRRGDFKDPGSKTPEVGYVALLNSPLADIPSMMQRCRVFTDDYPETSIYDIPDVYRRGVGCEKNNEYGRFELPFWDNT